VMSSVAVTNSKVNALPVIAPPISETFKKLSLKSAAALMPKLKSRTL